jgi:hypothetical protein
VAPDDAARARVGDGGAAGEWLVMDRGGVAVAANLGTAPATVPLPWAPQEVFGPDGPLATVDAPPSIILGPDEVAVAVASFAPAAPR